MAIKLVVSDIDGTLIDSTETVSQELVEIVKKCRKQGIVFSFATGRTKELTTKLVRTLDITDPYVISNGACIFQGEKCLVSHSFSVEDLLPVLRRADAAGLTVTLADEWTERALRLTDYVRSHQKFGDRFQSFIDLDTFDWANARFVKVMFMDEHRTGRIHAFREELLRDFSDRYWVTTYADAAVELGPLGCNKMTGVRELAELLEIQQQNVMACGDFENDLEMVEYAGVGVAVQNACDMLKARADYVASKPCSYGVVEAIENFCFGGI